MGLNCCRERKEMGDFERECLEAHNQYRAKHGCPPLVLNRDMCNYATQWAQNLARRNMMQHRSPNKYGENLFMAGGRPVGGRDAVDAWYNEIKDYRYNNPQFSMHTGHFTQVVWKGSKQMGVGVAKNGSSTYVVANYDPPGNMLGDFQRNVPPPL